MILFDEEEDCFRTEKSLLKGLNEEEILQTKKAVLRFLVSEPDMKKRKASRYGRPTLSFYKNGLIDFIRVKKEKGFYNDFGAVNLVF